MISQPASYSLSKLMNNLFEIGHFPDLWKIAHVSKKRVVKKLRRAKKERSVGQISPCEKTKRKAGELVEVLGRTFRLCQGLLKGAIL